MRILYGINGTGNGHRSRAKELVPALSEHSQVDVLVSGLRYSLPMPFPVRYEFHGVSFVYKNGHVSSIASALRSNPITLIKDVYGLDVDDYDLVVSDFEPISAWAATLRGVSSVHVSHQASFLSPDVPRPKRRDPVSEKFIRHFATARHSIGLHYRRYAEHVRPPIIRDQVCALQPTDGEDVAVYLPAVSLNDQIRTFDGLNGQFRVFSSEVSAPTQETPNVYVQPPSDKGFADAMAAGFGVIGHSGFELPSEAMYLGKPMMSVPIGRQYEQQCNAAALEELGVAVVWKWSSHVRDAVRTWLDERPVVQLEQISSPEELAAEILELAR